MLLKIQRMFDHANHIVFLTGAGVSTASGIPDYRSKNGLYRNLNRHGRSTEWCLSRTCLLERPRIFNRYIKQLYHPQAQPNVIHKVQAKLTRMGKAYIITQNIDNLYHKSFANLDRLIEFHGNLYQCYCMRCKRPVSWQRYLQDPIHEMDGGLIRPNIVLYGEPLNQRKFSKSVHVMLSADLIVVVGTTMKVEPFADLIKYHQPHVPIIIINEQPLHFSYNLKCIMFKMNAVDFFHELKI